MDILREFPGAFTIRELKRMPFWEFVRWASAARLQRAQRVLDMRIAYHGEGHDAREWIAKIRGTKVPKEPDPSIAAVSPKQAAENLARLRAMGG